VAGLNTGAVRPDLDGTTAPSIQWPICGIDASAAAAGEVSVMLMVSLSFRTVRAAIL
jgi:hypothetical protein